MFIGANVRFAIATAVLLFGASWAYSGTLVVVVDPGGQAVQSEIFRMKPSPERHLGRTDPNGRLSLGTTCPTNSYLRADPPPDYDAQGTYCDATTAEVRIEVTPVSVIATLESNFKAARDAGNLAAVAQIASELADRTRFRDPTRANYFRNESMTATARMFSPDLNARVARFNDPNQWGAPAGELNLNRYSSLKEINTNNVHWEAICKQSDLLRCTDVDSKLGVSIDTSEGLKKVISTKTAIGIDAKQWSLVSPVWLKGYSLKDSHTLLYTVVGEEEFKQWKSPEG
jgi:hypothetical protein